jgi:outer membrane protein W
MKYAVVVLVLFAAFPLAAQNDMQITGYVSDVQIESEEEFGEIFQTDFDDGFAMGVSVNRFFNNFLALEASVFDLRNEATVAFDNQAISIGEVNLTPVMVGVQAHLAQRSRIDPYIGAGAAYVMARDLFSPELELAGMGRIELEDKITYYANAGLGIGIAGGFGVVIDGRWIPYKTDSTSTATGVAVEMDLTPLILSLGLRFQF